MAKFRKMHRGWLSNRTQRNHPSLNSHSPSLQSSKWFVNSMLYFLLLVFSASIEILNAQSLSGIGNVGNRSYLVDTSKRTIHIFSNNHLADLSFEYSNSDSVVRDFSNIYLLKRVKKNITLKLLDNREDSKVFNLHCDSFRIVSGGLVVFNKDSMGVLSQGNIHYHFINNYYEILFSKYDMFFKYGQHSTKKPICLSVLTRDFPILMSAGVSTFLYNQLHFLGNDSVIYFGSENKIEFLRTKPRFLDFDSNFICFLDNGEKPVLVFADSGFYSFNETNSLFIEKSKKRWYVGNSINDNGTGIIQKINSNTGIVLESHKIAEPISGAVFLNGKLYISTYTGKILQFNKKFKVINEYDCNKTANIKRVKFTGIMVTNTSEIAVPSTDIVLVFSDKLKLTEHGYPSPKNSPTAFVDLYPVFNSDLQVFISAYKNACTMIAGYQYHIDMTTQYNYKCIHCDEFVDQKFGNYPQVFVMGVDSNFVYLRDGNKLNKYNLKEKPKYYCKYDSGMESKYVRYFKSSELSKVAQLEMASPMELDSINIRLHLVGIQDFQCSKESNYDCIESGHRMFFIKNSVELIMVDLLTKEVRTVDLFKRNMYLISVIPIINGDFYVLYGSIPKYNSDGSYTNHAVVNFWNSAYERKFDSLQIRGKNIVLNKAGKEEFIPTERLNP